MLRVSLVALAVHAAAALSCASAPPNALIRAGSAASPHSTRVRCQQEDDGDGAFQVCLRDTDDDRTLECTLLETMETETDLFASMTPVDVAAVMATLEGNQMVEVDDLDLVDALMPTAQAPSLH